MPKSVTVMHVWPTLLDRAFYGLLLSRSGFVNHVYYIPTEREIDWEDCRMVKRERCTVVTPAAWPDYVTRAITIASLKGQL